MTIDEAIKHSEEVAERYEKMEDSHDEKLKEECLQCAADYRQLAEWLKELKELKSSKLVKIKDEDFMTQGYLTIEKYYCCPKCGEVFGNVRMSKRSQLAEMYKYCCNCGQGLKWS